MDYRVQNNTHFTTLIVFPWSGIHTLNQQHVFGTFFFTADDLLDTHHQFLSWFGTGSNLESVNSEKGFAYESQLDVTI